MIRSRPSVESHLHEMDCDWIRFTLPFPPIMQRENAKHAFHTSLRQNPLLRGYYMIIHTQNKILYTTLKKPLISDKQMHWLFSPYSIHSVAVNQKTIISAVIRLIAQTVLLLNRETPGWDYICSAAKRGHFFRRGGVRVLFISNFIVDIFHSVDFFKEKEVSNGLCNESLWDGTEWELFIRNLFETLSFWQNSNMLIYSERTKFKWERG